MRVPAPALDSHRNGESGILVILRMTEIGRLVDSSCEKDDFGFLRPAELATDRNLRQRPVAKKPRRDRTRNTTPSSGCGQKLGASKPYSWITCRDVPVMCVE